MFDRGHHSPHVLSPSHAAESYLGHVDPRARIVAALVLSVAIAAAGRLSTLGIALAAAVLAAALARISPADLLRRLLPLEILLLALVLLLPWTMPAAPPVDSGPGILSCSGMALAAVIAMKANAIVLALLALLGSMDATMLGHALSHLHVPQKLAHLLLFTVRYMDVLHHEYRRLRAAMKIRSFRPRMNLHTYRAYGYLVGMLLVRSLDRSERILSAMKCRGFQGRFYLLDHFAFSRRRDMPFCAAVLGLLAILLVLEWT